MNNVRLYNNDGTLLLDIPVDDGSYRMKKIMGENILSLNFSMGNYIDIPVGTYCEYKAERYTLYSVGRVKKRHTYHFDYSLVLGAYQEYLGFVKYKFFDVDRTPGQPDRMMGPAKLNFSLTATPEDFVQLMVDNLNIEGGFGWEKGECLQADPVNIDFNHDDCFSALQKIADTFKSEWEVSGKKIAVRKVERLDGEGRRIGFPLSYGYQKGILGQETSRGGVNENNGIGIERKQYDDKNVINRLYIQGGDRNINRAAYGNDTLLMPKEKTIIHEGIEYRTDETGSYIERAGRTGLIAEDSLKTESIYPHRDGTVTLVEQIDDSKGRYNIIDADIPEALDYSKCIIPGSTMTVVFQTGQLAGLEFEVKYTHSVRRFELKPITPNGLTYPQGSIIPVTGDKYGVFHISLPQEYIDEAENEVLSEAVKYLHENSVPRVTYLWQLDSIYAKKNWGEIGGYLDLGYFVQFTDGDLLPEETDIRIVSVKEFINRPRLPIIEIANNITGKSLGGILNEIPTQEQSTDRKDNVIMQYFRRTWSDVMDTIAALQDAMLEFSDPINPITVQTMLALIGDEGLQFRFVDNITDPVPVVFNIEYKAEEKKLYLPAAILQHMTIGIDNISSSHKSSEYHFWDMREYVSDALTDTEQGYYVYAKVERNGILGSFLISPTAIEMKADADYYHLLIGILNPERSGTRSFARMYGFTEILPGRITTDRIVSSDGLNYLDLLHNALHLTNGLSGDNEQTLDWSNGTLTLTNATIKNALKVFGEALIAGFKFSNQVIKSTAMVDTEHAMILDGMNGFIEVNAEKTISGNPGSTPIKSKITISKTNGAVICGSTLGNTSVSANGIEARYANGRLTNDSFTPVAAVSATSKGDDSDLFQTRAAIYGKNERYKTNNMPDTFGGIFEELLVKGLVMDMEEVTDSVVPYTISARKTFVLGSVSSQRVVYLPNNSYPGTVVFIKQLGTSRLRVTPQNGQLLYDDSTPNDYKDVTEGMLAVCIYLGEKDVEGNIRGRWSFNQFGW